MGYAMWAIVVVTLGLLTGPQTFVVTDAGTFPDKAKCETAMSEGLRTGLDNDPELKAAYQDGYRQYVCVRVEETGAAHGAK